MRTTRISGIFHFGVQLINTGKRNRCPHRIAVLAVGLISLTLGFGGSLNAQTQTDISGPAGSGSFGSSVVILSNGNFVVADPDFDEGLTDVGAIYLYNGQTGQLIVRMIGGTAEDKIGSGGVFALPNGNYVVSSPNYDGAFADAGAVSFCNGNSGCSQVGSSGSMFGDRDGVRISGIGSSSSAVFRGITVLTNGNFVVVSPDWGTGQGFGGLGAATFCSGTAGCPAMISTANSLRGAVQFDAVGSTGGGQAIKNGVAPLTNGNYVVTSANFNDGTAFPDVGASTFCNGTSGCTGVVSLTNSLLGFRGGDRVGETTGGDQGVVALSNGRYVVRSTSWGTAAATRVGAVTYCGVSGCIGRVDATNSLVGSTTDDNVGGGSLVVLTNGNYVVNSPTWDNAATANVGSSAFCLGTNGCTGTVSPANSLVGTAAQDRVGSNVFGGAVALTNGNYVVVSEQWNGTSSSVGAVTFCNGLSGCSGSVSANASLIGSTALDSVGNRGVTPLPNGNYVVISSSWDGSSAANVGAVTYCSGTSGCGGSISLANSLVGVTAIDSVGEGGVVALTNGNYVVGSPRWDNTGIVDVGASTLCNGTTGCSGTVSTTNSLIGGTAGDQINRNRAVALTNGNYVVPSERWDNPATTVEAGAATWCSGTNGCVGTVSTSNSLVGSTANDQLSLGTVVTALPGGNYVVGSRFWDDGQLVDAGAVTFGKGDGSTTGPITAANSVRGTTTHPASTGQVLAMVPVFDSVNQQLIVGRRLDNKVTIFRPGTPRRTPFDFDGDGRSDLGVFRSSEANWYRQNSSDSSFASFKWGLTTDKIVPADYDGDGKTDHSIYRDGVWWIFQSSNSQVRVVQFGISGDLPRPGDYDADGLADLCIFRPSTATWWRQNSSGGQVGAVQFGANGDVPMLGDFDGDGKVDLAVFRPSTAVWYVLRSSDGQVQTDQFGLTGDIPLNGDFNADNKADLAIFRPSNGVWYVARPTGVPSQNFDTTRFGLATDIPVPADYDGDGRTDIAIYRNGVWWVMHSSSGQILLTQFGVSSDKPVEASYLP